MATGSASDVDFEKVDFESLLNLKNFITKGAFGEIHGPFVRNSKKFAVKRILISQDGLTNFKIKVDNRKTIWTSLKHKQLIEIPYVRLETRAVYLIMEYASGGSLRQLLDRTDVKVHHQVHVSNWARQIAEGMLYLHDKDIVHRDLKSSNIVLMEPFDSLNAQVEVTLKITDFDSVQEHVGTATMSLSGTCTHMAPEVLLKQWFSKASDVWSYGVVVWEMLTRKLPHDGQTVGPLVGKAISGKLTLPIPESIPKVFEKLLRGCWYEDTKSRRPFKEITDRLISLCETERSVLKQLKRVSAWLAENIDDETVEEPAYGPPEATNKPEDSLKSCEVCNEEFPAGTSEDEMTQHRDNHNGQVCPICFMQFDMDYPEENVMAHVNHHLETSCTLSVTRPEDSLKSCEVCNKEFPAGASEDEMTQHREHHNGQVCPICFMQFEMDYPEENVMAHVNRHLDNPNEAVEF